MISLSANTLPAGELIGLTVYVAHCPDPGLQGVSGIVIDESRNLLRVESGNRLIHIPKHGSSFIFELPNGDKATVQGSKLRFRPEDRIKKGLRNRE